MEIIWEVEDGYAGGSRPQHTDIDDEEIMECESVEEALALVEDYVGDDFANSISWYFNNRDDIIDATTRLFENKR